MQVGILDVKGNEQVRRVYSAEGLSPTLNTMAGGNRQPKILRPERTEYGKAIKKQYEAGEVKESRHNMTELKPREDGISNTLTTVQKDNLLLEPKVIEDFYSNRDIRVYEDCPTLRSERTGLKVAVREATIQKIGNYHESNHESNGNAQIMQNYRIRKLTPKEYWRLMGFTDEEFAKAEEVNSNSQLYKQAGNSIVVDVLEYIFKNLLK